MESPNGVKIPDNWLIDTGINTYWPNKEGIWANDDTKPILRFVAVYENLIEIPEAKQQLNECNEQFVNDFASELLGFFKPVMQQVREGKKPSTPEMSEAEREKASAIYQTWVNDWALEILRC